MSKSIGAVALMILLTACVAPLPRRVPLTPPAGGAGSPAVPAAGTYQIDSDQSELRVLVYRAGSLAHLGHNHVLVNHGLSGEVIVGPTWPASSFALRLPVDKFRVDDASARREEGADFPGEVPDEAKTGTLRNMLSANQLNAARFPVMLIEGTVLDDSPDAPMATMKLNVAGHESSLRVPFFVQAESGRLTASASFELRQTALGLTPYSLLGGALQVQDALQVKIRIVATAP